MKLGRKGFMLAEVVVVAVVIATVLVTLFAGLNNVSSAYETRNKYYDVDSLYIAMEINDILIRENTIDDKLNENDITLLNDDVKNFTQFYENSIGYTITSYFVPYWGSGDENDYTLEAGLNNLKSKDINATFVDYADYLLGNLDFEDDYDYIIIVERKNVSDANDCYYYALKLKK